MLRLAACHCDLYRELLLLQPLLKKLGQRHVVFRHKNFHVCTQGTWIFGRGETILGAQRESVNVSQKRVAYLSLGKSREARETAHAKRHEPFSIAEFRCGSSVAKTRASPRPPPARAGKIS